MSRKNRSHGSLKYIQIKWTRDEIKQAIIQYGSKYNVSFKSRGSRKAILLQTEISKFANVSLMDIQRLLDELHKNRLQNEFVDKYIPVNAPNNTSNDKIKDKEKTQKRSHRKKRVKSCTIRPPTIQETKYNKKHKKKKKQSIKVLKETNMNNAENQIVICIDQKPKFVQKIVTKSMRSKKRQKLNGIGLLLLAANDIASKEKIEKTESNQPSFESLLPALF